MSLVKQRILSLDVYRGFIIVLMILVNSQYGFPGYDLLLHKDWNGCSLADLVFPAFLFITGLTVALVQKKINDLPVGDTRCSVYKKIFRRACVIFLVGCILNIIPYGFHVDTFRIYGVLQRIAICYLLVSLLYLHATFRGLALLWVAILLAYWCLMTRIPVPNGTANILTPSGGWVSYVDQLVFSSKHLYAKTYDPEGFLTTIPALANALCGLLTGLLMKNANAKKAVFGLTCAGLIFLTIGYLWSYDFPLNKNLWTSSFVVWSSGWALLFFAFCYLLVDVLGYKKLCFPLKVFGMNSLFAFVAHVVFLKLLFSIKLQTSSGLVSLKVSIIQGLTLGLSPNNQNLVCGIVFILINYLFVYALYRKKIFISA
jgi:predicted acyltransferase